jgi:arsenite methyltransferase
VAQRAVTLALLRPKPGEPILDVGTGPGQLLEAVGARVGPGLAHGVDPSASMVTMGRERCGSAATVTRAGIDDPAHCPAGRSTPSSRRRCSSTSRTSPPRSPRSTACSPPGGRVLLLDTDWGSLVWNVTDRARHRRVLEAWEAHLAEPRLPRTLRTSLRAAGFVDVRVDVIPLLNAVRDPDTYSAGMIDMIARFVAGRDGLSRTGAQAWRDDVWEREDYFFSLNRYVFRGARPRGRSGVDGSSGARLTQPVDRLAADLGAAGHGEDGVLEARLEGPVTARSARCPPPPSSGRARRAGSRRRCRGSPGGAPRRRAASSPSAGPMCGCGATCMPGSRATSSGP